MCRLHGTPWRPDISYHDNDHDNDNVNDNASKQDSMRLLHKASVYGFYKRLPCTASVNDDASI